MYVGACLPQHVCRRGQLVEISSLLPPCSPGDQSLSARLGSRWLYPLGHLVSPTVSFSKLLEKEPEWLSLLWNRSHRDWAITARPHKTYQEPWTAFFPQRHDRLTQSTVSIQEWVLRTAGRSTLYPITLLLSTEDALPVQLGGKVWRYWLTLW